MAGKDRMALGNGMELRLLSALETMQARREAADLARGNEEMALCSNACLLARALEQAGEHKAVFPDGRAVLKALTVEEIEQLAGQWAGFCRENNPGLNLFGSELENVKKNFVLTQEGVFGGGC